MHFTIRNESYMILRRRGFAIKFGISINCSIKCLLSESKKIRDKRAKDLIKALIDW